MDNIQDLNLEGEMIGIGLIIDIMFTMKNLKLLQTIVHDQILLKIWCIRLRSLINMCL